MRAAHDQLNTRHVGARREQERALLILRCVDGTLKRGGVVGDAVTYGAKVAHAKAKGLAAHARKEKAAMVAIMAGEERSGVNGEL